MIDFKDEVLKRKEQMIKDLTSLIKVNSELTSFDENRVGAPFGEGIKEALDLVLEIAKRDGFTTLNLDGYAGHIEYGNPENPEFIGSMGHLDVVPAGNGWKFPPYGAVINDNKMYGRGTEDDKGPTIAFYYAMKILKELELPLSKRIKLVIGTDEETKWRGVSRYFEKYPEMPVAGFIPDADFPLIYAEKGIAKIVVKGKMDSQDVLSIKGGFRDNMVPDYAEAIIYTAGKAEKRIKDFDKFLKKKNITGKVTTGIKYSVFKVDGKSAHGSTPDLGVNAIDLIFSFLSDIGISNTLTKLVENNLSNDNYGKKLDINYKDKEMGALTNNFGVINFANNEYEIILNLRYPNNVKFDNVIAKMTKAFEKYDAVLSVDKHQLLLYNDPNSDLVKTLMNAYKKHTNDIDAKPITIGGGTYARAMKNTVAFGPHFPNKESFIHQKDEYIDIDDLVTATIIYVEALYELAK